MKTPQANEFLRAWSEVTSARQAELIENWDKRRNYTSIIQKEPGCIIEKVAETLGLRCYTEYYHTDAFLYSEAHLVPERIPKQWWFRGIKVAFEHEHVYNKRLYEEISHLLLLHAELSVVVTYPPGRDFSHLEHLAYFHSLIKGSPRADDLDQHENFLLIFGYRDPFTWQGLIYKNDGWKELSLPGNNTTDHTNRGDQK